MSTQQPLIQEQSVFLTVWDDAWASIAKPRHYVKWAVQPLRRSIGYICIIFAAMSLVTTVYAGLVLKPQVEEAQAWVSEHVPQVTLQGGKLSIAEDKTFTFSDRDIFIRVDASDAIADVGIDTFYENGLIIAQDGLVWRAEGQTQRVSYAELGLRDFATDGQELAKRSRTWVLWVLAALPFIMFAFFVASNFTYTALFSLFVTLVSGFQLPFKAVWAMALHALTPSLLASYILFVLYPLAFVPTIVFVVYMVMAVNNFRRFLDIKNHL